MMQSSKYRIWGKGLKQLKCYTKIGGSSAATKLGVNSRLLFTVQRNGRLAISDVLVLIAYSVLSTLWLEV